jgi:3-dehydroquinate synthetase
VVARDEREAGRRAALNFGHTVAHPLETASRYRVPHGAAVSIGMVVEARLAVEVTGFPASHARRLVSLLEGLGLPVRLPRGLPREALVAATRRDKKARSGEARFALPLRLGRMPAAEALTVPVAEDRLRAALDPAD